MAVVAAVIKDFKVLEGPQDQTASTTKRMRVLFLIDNGATQVAGGTDTLDLVVSTACQNALRRSDTFTLRDWAVWQTGRSTSTDYAATGTVSGSTISLTPKTPADWSTNATVAASALVVPYGIFCTVDVT